MSQLCHRCPSYVTNVPVTSQMSHFRDIQANHRSEMSQSTRASRSGISCSNNTIPPPSGTLLLSYRGYSLYSLLHLDEYMILIKKKKVFGLGEFVKYVLGIVPKRRCEKKTKNYLRKNKKKKNTSASKKSYSHPNTRY